jgi:oligopeptide/dipeptide ABC transporter ATP-binding protein
LALLEIRDLSVSFHSTEGLVSAVSDVSADVEAGEIFGIVGESGCGKTTLAMSLIGLLPSSARVGGEIRFAGTELLALGEVARRSLRGRQIAMIFQDPLSSLDPAFGVGSQVADTIRAHQRIGNKAARKRATDLLREVGIPSPESRYDDPPHRFSGGMRQRVVIAAALANNPSLLIADEPTTALDVTIQAQILGLLRDLVRRYNTTVILIAHDFGVIAQLCDRVGVMYAGQLIELAPVAQIFREARHPYTRALLGALPASERARGALRVIPGQVPDLSHPPRGCRFHPRCEYRMDKCFETPLLVGQGPRQSVACWLYPTPGLSRFNDR